MTDFKYRPEIDGLRAIAVLLVLLFHADFGFTGGFIGVDVFFAISGFLITSLILKEQQAGSFTLAGFWKRRIRRIFPVATLVVLATTFAGILLLLPDDLVELSESAIAQQIMLANVFFYQNTGYFAGPAEAKPLLHTWSLAVEEQFYLVYPILLVVGTRLPKRIFLILLVTLAAISLAMSEWGTRPHSAATFFLLAPRGWELLLGALVAFAPPTSGWRRWNAELLSVLGFAAILVPGWIYNSETPFPGFTALIPCLGTAVLIYSNLGSLTWIGTCLSRKPVVFIGLISYSLYLWHWPILALLKYWFEDHVTVGYRMGALAASGILAYLSWRFVETPFRRGFQQTSGGRIALTTAIGLVCVTGFAFWIRSTNGLPSRLPENLQTLADVSEPTRYTGSFQGSQLVLPVLGKGNESGTLDVMIWGDSHADFISDACQPIARRHGVSGVIAASPGMIPLLGTWRPSGVGGAGSESWNAMVLGYVRRNQIKNVILVGRWAVNIDGRTDGNMDSLIVDELSEFTVPSESRAAMLRGFQRTLKELNKDGIKVWVLKQVPLQDGFPHKRLLRWAFFGGGELPTGVSRDIHNQRQFNVDSIFKQPVFENVRILDPANYCFDGQGRSQISDGRRSYYWDNDHLTADGASTLLTPMLDPIFIEIARKKKSDQESSSE
ncbi:MAG: hypothetical protein CMJ78_04430 [Planctomycetaceae bacterium]|nr:hypothetical protein [Planctomycetaceae bacterium]